MAGIEVSLEWVRKTSTAAERAEKKSKELSRFAYHVREINVAGDIVFSEAAVCQINVGNILDWMGSFCILFDGCHTIVRCGGLIFTCSHDILNPVPARFSEDFERQSIDRHTFIGNRPSPYAQELLLKVE